MMEKLRFLGLDVHAETIAVAIAEPDGEVRSLGTILNRAESIRKLIRKVGSAEKLRACYEAISGHRSPPKPIAFPCVPRPIWRRFLRSLSCKFRRMSSVLTSRYNSLFVR